MKMMNTLFILLTIVMGSCNNNGNNKTAIKRQDAVKTIVKKSADSNENILNSPDTSQANKNFMKFVKKFDPIDLPFKMDLSSEYWRTPMDKGIKIPKKIVKEFLLSDNEDTVCCIKHYYGLYFILDSTIGLIYQYYNYYSEPFFVGFKLTTFDLKGNLKKTIYFTGNEGDNESTVQIDSRISSKGEIVSNYIDFNFNPKRYYHTGAKEKSTLKIKYFQIKPDGLIKKIKEVTKKNQPIEFPDDNIWPRAVILKKNRNRNSCN